jgi:diacylglycerol kinase (ATP)
MPGIGLITNPRARTNQKDPGGMRRLGYLLGSRGLPEATKSLDDLYRVAEEFRCAGIDLLGINGGDGTIGCTLTAFIKVYKAAGTPMPLVAILRGGTMNTIANSIGIRGAPGRLLFDLLDRYHNLEPFTYYEREVLKVGDDYGFIFGNGLIHNFLKAYYGTGNPCPQVAARVLFRGIFSAMTGSAFAQSLTKRFRAHITADGHDWAVSEFTTVAAATVEQIGLGFQPFYRTNERPGTFACLGIHTSAFGFTADLPRIRLGRPMRRDKVIDVVAREVLFESAEPLEYTLDGDTHETGTTLAIQLGPRLRFIVPDTAPERFCTGRVTAGEARPLAVVPASAALAAATAPDAAATTPDAAATAPDAAATAPDAAATTPDAAATIPPTVGWDGPPTSATR